MYIIWHDNDLDLALWVYENSCLKNKRQVVLRQIPKTNDKALLTSDFTEKTDYFILPYIKFATPDILIQRIDEYGASKILVVTEFMTHTPHHDHIFQRFERIFCVAKEHVPVALVLPIRKIKIERGSEKIYKEKSYSPNPLTVHLYLKTTLINKSPTLMFFWPEKGGYLKFDDSHQTAPKVEGQVEDWFKFFNKCIEEDPDILHSAVVKTQYDYLDKKFLLRDKPFSEAAFEDYLSGIKTFYKLKRIIVVETSEVIKKYNLKKEKLSKLFNKNSKTVIFTYNSRLLRTDPYAGFLCGFKNLLCIDNEGINKANIILVPTGINYASLLKKTKNKPFEDISENLLECPVDRYCNLEKTGLDYAIQHVANSCIFTRSKSQRIFGTVADVIVFDDYIYYNKNYGD